jgi:hypothetical protein
MDEVSAPPAGEVEPTAGSNETRLISNEGQTIPGPGGTAEPLLQLEAAQDFRAWDLESWQPVGVGGGRIAQRTISGIDRVAKSQTETDKPLHPLELSNTGREKPGAKPLRGSLPCVCESDAARRSSGWTRFNAGRSVVIEVSASPLDVGLRDWRACLRNPAG